MEIEGPLNVEEVQEANILAMPKLLRGSARRRMRRTLDPPKWRIVLLAAFAVVLLAHAVGDSQATQFEVWAPVVLIAGIAAFQFFLGPKMARQALERRIAQIPRVISVGADGIRFEDRAKLFQFLPWSAYRTWREGSLIFILRGPQRVSSIVPKRGLAPQQIDELRFQLATHMPDSA